MSSLWTPGGEHPVGDRPPRTPGGEAGGSGPGGQEGPDRPAPRRAGPPPGTPGTEEAAAIEELRRQLTQSPPEVVVANHAYGMFELAAIYLSQDPPMLAAAQLAIDAMGALIEGLQGRLGENEPSLKDALAQIRLAYVQLEAAARAPSAGGSTANGSTSEDGAED